MNGGIYFIHLHSEDWELESIDLKLVFLKPRKHTQNVMGEKNFNCNNK